MLLVISEIDMRYSRFERADFQLETKVKVPVIVLFPPYRSYCTPGPGSDNPLINDFRPIMSCLSPVDQIQGVQSTPVVLVSANDTVSS